MTPILQFCSLLFTPSVYKFIDSIKKLLRFGRLPGGVWGDDDLSHVVKEQMSKISRFIKNRVKYPTWKGSNECPLAEGTEN